MLKKGLKYFFVFLGMLALLFVVFVFLLIKSFENERQQERTAIVELLNKQKAIIDVTGVITDVERKITHKSDGDEQEREVISFAGDKGKAVIEGERQSDGEMVVVTGTMTVSGETVPVRISYPKGKTKLSFSWDFSL